MNQQDKAFVKMMAVVLGGLVGLAIILWIGSLMISGAAGPAHDRSELAQANIERRLQPVGRVVVAGSPEAEAEEEVVAAVEVDEETVPGQAVYNSACAACHAAGVLAAPVTGDQEAWGGLYREKGLDTLVHNAINGINQMPARGGNPNLSDDDIHDSVLYMLLQSDVEVAEVEDGVAVDQVVETAVEDAAETAEEEIAETTDVVEEDAETSEETTEVAETAEEETAVAEAENGYRVPSDIDPAAGQSTYNMACTVCHGQGIAGAPKTGDQEAWGERIAQGWDVLAEHTLQGIRGMPAKGGRPDLPDDEILRAMAYMIEESR